MKKNKMRCILMGEQSRLVQCGELLIQYGYEISFIISDKASIVDWALERRLSLISPQSDIVEHLNATSFEIFFSIDNFMKVPNEILTMPQLYAINFHDAPLPRYAGNNAANWALLNQEAMHGITWHLMTDTIDAGKILNQKFFPIKINENAVTLNVKCYEESIRGFEDMIKAIRENRLKPIIQDLDKRTFYHRWKRPKDACTIDWKQPAEKIDALHRALDFGTYPNPIGLLKLFLGKDIVVVKKVELLNSAADEPAGTIKGIENGRLIVAATTQNIALSDFQSLKGKPIHPEALLYTGNVKIGDTLKNLDENRARKISEIHSRWCRHENFWVKRLKDISPIDIPYAKSRSLKKADPSFSQVEFNVPNEFRDLEIDMAKAPGDLLMAVFFIYLYRFCDKIQFDIAYGNPSLKKETEGIEDYFASFVPLRINVDPDLNINQFTEIIFNGVSEINRHQSYVRDLMLRYPELHHLLETNAFPDLTVSVERLPQIADKTVTTEYDLHLVIPDNGFNCLWIYNKNTFDEKDIMRMQEQFYTLVKDLSTGRRDRLVSQLSILSEAERDTLVNGWNNTFADYPADICLHHLFESQVKQTPDSIALVYGGTRLNYRELNARANKLAHYLKKNNVGSETLVGLFMERSLEMVIAIYGIIKAGGAYVPLDPEYPAERISYMIDDTQVPVILTQNHLKTALPKNNATVVCLDSEWALVEKEHAGNPDINTNPQNLAYVIYTSGSTGKPKGVMNEHRGICNRLLWMQDEYKLTPDDSVLQKTPFSFDVSVWEFFWPLLFGARLVIAPPEAHKDPRALVDLIIGNAITTIHFVPSMLQLFLENNDVGTCKGLMRVICSGEALDHDLKERFFQKIDNAELHNLYGPTEAAVDVTFWKCRRGDDLHTVPIGYPIANTRIYILDTKMRPVPMGVPGELHIGGVQVARGYINRPRLTTERFIPDPFSSDPEARLYKTGDLCRHLPGGAIEYLGRMDFQVKIRGLRIELGEIESILSQHSGVREAVVTVLPEDSGANRLVAYFVPAQGERPTMEKLRNFLGKKLPDYMVPELFVMRDAFPLTSSGKTDRKALPKPDTHRPEMAQNYVPPSNDIDRKLADIWCRILNLDTVGIHDAFFSLGGNSLKLIQAVAKIQEELCIGMSAAKMLQYPTINQLATYIEGGKTGSQESNSKLQIRAKLRKAAMAKRNKAVAG